MHHLDSHLRQVVGVAQCCGDVEPKVLAVLNGGVSQADAQRASLHQETVASDLCHEPGGKQSRNRQALLCLVAVSFLAMWCRQSRELVCLARSS